jgi:hypothetical protein
MALTTDGGPCRIGLSLFGRGFRAAASAPGRPGNPHESHLSQGGDPLTRINRSSVAGATLAATRPATPPSRRRPARTWGIWAKAGWPPLRRPLGALPEARIRACAAERSITPLQGDPVCGAAG